MNADEHNLCDALLMISDKADQLAGSVQADRPHPEYIKQKLLDIEHELKNAWTISNPHPR